MSSTIDCEGFWNIGVGRVIWYGALLAFIIAAGPVAVCIIYILSSGLACLGGGWCWYKAAIPGP